MIKPQNIPDMFEDFTKALRNPAIADAHMSRSFMSKAAAVRAVMDENEVSTKKLKDYFQTVVKEKFALLRESLESDSIALYYCDDDMSDMVQMGASVLDTSDLASLSLFPSTKGFCYFNKGVSLTEDMMIHALSWHEVYSAEGERVELNIVAYNDAYNETDGAIEAWKDSFSRRGYSIPVTRWIYRADAPYWDGGPIAVSKEVTDEIRTLSDFTPVDITPGQVLHSLILMLNQPPEIVTLTKREITNKKQKKRMKSAGTPSEVTIVDIRHKYRSVVASGSETDREYSRRWLVIGHWRWQPVKDRETNEMTRKRIWINPYIKGPADKPFVATKRVHALLK